MACPGKLSLKVHFTNPAGTGHQARLGLGLGTTNLLGALEEVDASLAHVELSLTASSNNLDGNKRIGLPFKLDLSFSFTGQTPAHVVGTRGTQAHAPRPSPSSVHFRATTLPWLCLLHYYPSLHTRLLKPKPSFCSPSPNPA